MTDEERLAADMQRLGPCTTCGTAPGTMRPQLCFECWRQDHPAFTVWHKRPTVRRRIKRAIITFFVAWIALIIIGIIFQ